MQTRIPAGSKVLLCTTTNKAIDSLAEKLYECGHRNILAFGNESRLGETSRKLTLPHRVAKHESILNVQKFRTVSDKALRLWDSLKNEAAQAEAEDVSTYDDALETLVSTCSKELKDLVRGTVKALKEFIEVPQHPASVSTLIRGTALPLLCMLQEAVCTAKSERKRRAFLLLYMGRRAAVLQSTLFRNRASECLPDDE